MSTKEIIDLGGRYLFQSLAVFYYEFEVWGPDLCPVEVELFEGWNAEKLVQHVTVGHVQVFQVAAEPRNTSQTLHRENVTVAHVQGH